MGLYPTTGKGAVKLPVWLLQPAVRQIERFHTVLQMALSA